jgi:hypothetical protein
VESGQKWPGNDLVAGLDLVKIFSGQDFANEIVKVDVSNFDGRVDAKEAQISLVTKYDTRIQWGRPVNSSDNFVEVAPARKLESLQQIWSQYHRIDGGRSWIDIRFDRITYPSGDVTADNAR